MKIIGLTGPTGAGKSTVSARLKKEGFYIADGDVIARRCTEPGSPLLPMLAETFGADVLKDGVLDRKVLARRAFASAEGVQKLNALMHPEIERRMFREIEEHPECEAAVIDAAALIESGIYKRCDFLVVVLADRKTRMERIMLRDAISKEDAAIRIGAQKDDAFYIEKADFVLYNDAPLSETVISELLERIRT